MQLLILVPNHLSTHKSNKNQAPYHTRIRHYSQLFHCFCHISSTFHLHYLGGGEDESGGEKEKDEKECGIPHRRWYGEKSWVHIDSYP